MTAPPRRPAPGAWREVRRALHRFFGARLADAAEREDLVQEVLLRMHERRDQLREEDRLEAWAYRIARHALIDHHRRRRPREPLPELAVEPPPPAGNDPALLGAWLRGQLATLPRGQREALELTELEGLSQRQVANRLDLPPSTVRSRVQRGRARLHATLVACCEVERDARGRVIDYAPRAAPPCRCDGS